MDDAYRLIRAFFDSTSEGLKVLNSEPELINARTEHLGETPLHYLAVENQLEAVQALVTRGADVNTVSDVGGTPLSETASLGHANIVGFLLSVGAKLDLQGQDEPTLSQAVSSGSSEIVRMILNAGADINIKNDLDETPLHVAASKNNVEMVRLLVSAGADASARCIFDRTPLDVARNSGAAAAEAELSGTDKSGTDNNMF